MSDVVALGDAELPGEVVAIDGERVTVQAYEYTGGLAPGDPVAPAGRPLSALLGPGLLGGVFDGLLRPLSTGRHLAGPRARCGPATDPRRWTFTPSVAAGRDVAPGDELGTVGDGGPVPLRVLVPPGLRRSRSTGSPRRGRAPRTRSVATVGGVDGAAGQRVAGAPAAAVPRAARRADGRCTPGSGCSTCSTRSRGAAAAAVPGRLRHRQDRAAAADRQVVRRRRHRLRRLRRARQRDGRRASRSWPSSTDPRTGGRLADRTVIIANTSNMPMMAREASIYTGVTVAEYFRDMGYHVGRHRRLHVAVGRGAAGVRLADRRAAGRGGLPGRPGVGAGRVLRAGRAGRRPSAAADGSVTDHRCGLAARRRHDRAGHRAHPAVRPSTVDTGPRPGLRPALPGGGLVGLVLPRRRRRSAPGTPATATRRGRTARGPDGWRCSPRPTGSAALAELVGVGRAARRPSGW